MIVTIYSGAREPKPAHVADLEWPELAAELAALANTPTGAPPTASVAEQKRCMVAWSPHKLRVPYRLEANVDHVSLLVLDVDGDANPAAVAERLAEQGTAALIYESASSTPEAPRFRVVAPTSRPIAPDECRATRIAFAESLGLEPGCGVEGAVDASKLFFAGRLHGTPERLAEIFEGSPVDVDALPKPVLKWGSAKKAPELKPLDELPPANAGLAAALGDWAEHDGRKFDLCGAVGGMMRKLGYSAEQCAAELRAWLPADEPDVNVAAGVRYALRAWGLEPEQVSGHGKLAELLGLEHARVVETAAVERSPVRLAMPPRLRGAPGPLVAAAAPGWTRPPVTADDPLGRRVSFSDPEEPIEYYCEGLKLAPSDGKISLIAGLPGAGKGPIADHLAVCFATGNPAFGRFPCRKSRVLLLDCEGLRLTMRRMRRMARAIGVDPRDLPDPRDVSSTMLLTDATLQAIEAEAPEVVILDSYTSAMLSTGLDSFKPEFAQLAQLLGGLGVLTIAVAHANKVPAQGERPTLGNVAGSFALAAMAQTGICCWHPTDKEGNPVNGGNTITVACMRAPETAFEKFDVEFRNVEGDGLALSVATAAEQKAARHVSIAAERSVQGGRILALLRDRENGAGGAVPLNMNQIHEGTGLHVSDVLKQVMPALVDAGFVQRQIDGSRIRYVIVGDAPSAVVFGEDGRYRAKEPAAEGTALAGFRR